MDASMYMHVWMCKRMYLSGRCLGWEGRAPSRGRGRSGVITVLDDNPDTLTFAGEFYMGEASSMGANAAGVMAINRPQKLREIIQILKSAYCMGIGVEFMHIADMDQQNWIRDKFEKADKFQHSKEDIIKMADRLVFACNFESFLATKYGVTKRFGLEGLEALIPGMKAMVDTGAELGCEYFAIGMPHRGRLNVLANVMHKPMEEILEEFMSGTISADDKKDTVLGSGDVKYHLGYSNDRVTRCGKMVHLSLAANPSHLEAANTVVLGKTRAKQHYLNDEGSRRKAMSVLLHGDAAFAGQGIVWETLALSDIKGYTTGGTIHIIANNQIGFTTDPRFARSSPYCTDIAKSVQAPVFHVNADDLEAVCWVCSTAAAFRQKFGKDVVVDIVGYRRYGHNEIDEPTFTQPFMYSRISQTATVLQKFKQLELTKGLLTLEEAEALEANCLRIFEEAFTKARANVETWEREDSRPPLMSSWQGIKDRFTYSAAQETGVDEATLLDIGGRLASVPADFHLHRGLKRVMDAKKKMFETKQGIDWATAEALAFGSLLVDGTHVRLSGQDVERGTFSHRHALLHDQENEAKYVPLQNLAEKQAALAIFNSNLSEYGVLGFELGYSLQNPNSLVLWEAQFGDFANTAQVIIDQFISSGEQKWLRQSGLVMLLPHGYEGQGPEHSSARLERFLQMSDEDAAIVPDSKGGKESMQIQRSNWQIVNITTPANYFHCLRRQVKRGFRKPLVVFSPKSLLRHPQVVSSLADMATGKKFLPVIDERFPDQIKAPADIDRILICSGKVCALSAVTCVSLASPPAVRCVFLTCCRDTHVSLACPSSPRGRSTTNWSSGVRTTRWTTSPFLPWSRSRRSPLRRSRKCRRSTPRPSWCGCRRSRRTWAPGPLSSPALPRRSCRSTRSASPMSAATRPPRLPPAMAPYTSPRSSSS